ncbi:MAG: hypothetical protein CL941_00320 [Desulfobacter sp.]|nr:hypothetical protein [Desulfobacter sp.]
MFFLIMGLIWVKHRLAEILRIIFRYLGLRFVITVTYIQANKKHFTILPAKQSLDHQYRSRFKVLIKLLRQFLNRSIIA